MINQANNNSNTPDDYLDNDNQRSADNGNLDKLQERQFAESVAYHDTDKTDELDANTDTVAQADRNTVLHPSEQPLTTQGSEEEIEENLGGTTNLSLDQLKAERDPEGTPGK